MKLHIRVKSTERNSSETTVVAFKARDVVEAPHAECDIACVSLSGLVIFNVEKNSFDPESRGHLPATENDIAVDTSAALSREAGD